MLRSSIFAFTRFRITRIQNFNWKAPS